MIVEKIIEGIREAFSANKYPGDACLTNSNEGYEPRLLEKEFAGKVDWTTLGSEFLDQSPDGFGSALSFFSDEAFRFYLPAYLISDIQGELSLQEPVFFLIHGLDDASRDEFINSRRYGDTTWFTYATARFAMFSRKEVDAIVAYLHFKMETTDLPPEKAQIAQALNNYWMRVLEGEQ